MQVKINDIFMGIDVSKETLDISLNGRHKKTGNNARAISDFIKSDIAGKKIRLCVLEATGGYERLVMCLLQAAGIPVHRVHPNRLHSFAKAAGHFAKTDKLDAALLEKYAAFAADQEHGDKPLSESHMQMMDLMSVRRQMEEDVHANQCRLHNICGIAKKHLEAVINSTTEQLEKIEKEMELLIAADKELKEKRRLLTSYKGVGNRIAGVLLIELPELGSLSKKEVAALVGVAPRTNESGRKVGKGHIGGGRFYVRKALYMAALVAMRHNQAMKAIYDRMISSGKAAKVALTAIMRKIIVCLNAMVQNNETYRNPAIYS